MRSGHSGRHISRATSPWRRLTPPAARLMRRASWVTPTSSCASFGSVRPRLVISCGRHRQVVRQVDQRRLHLLGRVGVVSGGHRRVGGEDRARACALERLLRRAAVGHVLGRQLDRRQRRVPLVEMQRAGLDVHGAQGSHAAHAEHDVLREPRLRVADVQAVADPARLGVVVRVVGVEQVERHAADVDPPDECLDLALAERHLDRQRLALAVRHERRGQALGVRVDPVLVLPAGGVDALAEVALVVHQPDRDERQAAVRGLLHEVAGQRAEAARVDRQRAVDRVLGAEEGDRVLRIDAHVRGRPLELRLDVALELLRALHEARVVGGRVQRARGGLLEQPHRVAPGALPASRIDGLEDGRAVRVPAPAVVERGTRQRRQRIGHPLRQLRCCPLDIRRPVGHVERIKPIAAARLTCGA